MRETEKGFQQAVIDLALFHRWKVYHTFDSRRSAPGFPDLVLARSGNVIFAECKTDTGKLTQEQIEWLRQVNGVVWRPEYWPAIEDSLRDGAAYPTEPLPELK